MDEAENRNSGDPAESSRWPRCSQRLQRIKEYRRQALGRGDALMANLGAAASDLMVMEYHLSKALNTALSQTTNVVGEIADWSPAMQLCLQLIRQINRLANLEQRLGPPARSSQAPPAGETKDV